METLPTRSQVYDLVMVECLKRSETVVQALTILQLGKNTVYKWLESKRCTFDNEPKEVKEQVLRWGRHHTTAPSRAK